MRTNSICQLKETFVGGVVSVLIYLSMLKEREIPEPHILWMV